MGWLIAYDIACVRRWRRVHRLLRGQAAKMQYSLFWADISHAQARMLADRLAAMIDPAADDLRLYHLPDSARADMLGARPWPVGVADPAARRFARPPRTGRDAISASAEVDA